MITLSSVRPNQGATKKRKRVGRGNASGHGTYATRGLKGQKSRSGVTNLKRLGLKKMLLSVPKSRGFKSLKPKNQPVNLEDINDNFKTGQTVDPKGLLKAGLIGNLTTPVKVLGKGELTVTGLNFKGLLFSQTAEAAVAKAKGNIIK